MYRVDVTDTLEKIERLERELARAYEELRRPEPEPPDDAASLAVLRLRARRLEREVEALCQKKSDQKKREEAAAGKRRLRGLLTRGAAVGFAAGVIAGAGALALRAAHEDARAAEMAAILATLPVAKVEEVKSTTEEEAEEATPESEGEAAPAPLPLSAADYDTLLARSRAFFRAIERGDGAAIAKLAHPVRGLDLRGEQLRFGPAELRGCFGSTRLHEATALGGDEIRRETCKEVFSHYLEQNYLHAPDVRFNAAPSSTETPGFTLESRSEPSVFFFFPRDPSELPCPGVGPTPSWAGVALLFDYYESQLVLTEVVRASPPS